MKRIIIIIFFLLLMPISEASAYDKHQIGLNSKKPPITKENKLLYTNTSAIFFITAWGFINWDYGKSSAHAKSEDWFEEDTGSGGADKIGHMYTSYIASHALSSLYKSWGYSEVKASIYGALSSLGLMNFMEIGDAFSPEFGFSYEDMIMNCLGIYLGYLFDTNENIAKKIDLRIEYKPSGDEDIFTDYEHSKYLIAIKLDGFDSVKNRYLKYIELHLGYYTRGYEDADDEKKRKIYCGIGFNLSKLFHAKSYKKTATLFKYYQIPYTDISYKKPL